MWLRWRPLRGLASECSEERVDLEFALVGVSERETGVDLLAVAPADTLPRHVASVDEIIDQALCRPFGDANAVSELA